MEKTLDVLPKGSDDKMGMQSLLLRHGSGKPFKAPGGWKHWRPGPAPAETATDDQVLL